MKYVAVIFLVLLGLVEFVLRAAVALVTCLLVFIVVDDVNDYFTPFCFKLAEKALAS